VPPAQQARSRQSAGPAKRRRTARREEVAVATAGAEKAGAEGREAAAGSPGPVSPVPVDQPGGGASRLGEQDLYLLREGTHYRLYDKLGAHAGEREGIAGTWFAVWAPEAERVSVLGEWNGWDHGASPLTSLGGSGIWEGFAAGAAPGMRYKYHVVSRHRGYRADKADPFAFHAEAPPRQASVIWDLAYEWNDAEWMAERSGRQSARAPISIYEVHLGSWRRVPEEGDRMLSYRELAPLLADHVEKLGFTHVELLPIMEHPFYGSWGYQTTGYFAPSSRYGTPQDFMHLIDHLHQRGIGVILDWVPSHFPGDEHSLGFFDGTHLYEHADPRQGFHPDWNSYIFNYGRGEVRSFLGSSARFWLDRYHADALRVDAVASMLYRDYSRREGEWIPNVHGGRENLEAIAFLRQLNERLYDDFPDVQTIAEESTAWPMVSRPVYLGGLGFGFKWDMGWMHDTLDYFAKDPVHRKFHHNLLTFRTIYAWSESFVLPLSHDEVVHGKGSLAAKMPGDAWQKFANLRLLYAYMVAQPGKKLLFMGSEIGSWREWNHDSSLDWHLTAEPLPAGLGRFLADVLKLYRDEPALHQLDADPQGFEWIDCSDAINSTLALLRHGDEPGESVIAVLNFTPLPRTNYRIGAPGGGFWRELLNSDAPIYGGSGQGNFGGIEAAPLPLHGRTHSLALTLPPLGAVFLKRSE
jgi:1,4-alpha-glucan branching enzyme